MGEPGFFGEATCEHPECDVVMPLVEVTLRTFNALTIFNVCRRHIRWAETQLQGATNA